MERDTLERDPQRKFWQDALNALDRLDSAVDENEEADERKANSRINFGDRIYHDQTGAQAISPSLPKSSFFKGGKVPPKPPCP